MPIYDRPTKSLIVDWANEFLKPNQTFSKAEPTRWFGEQYPKIRPTTVAMHVEAMSTNNPIRRHHPNVKLGSGHDLFFKLGPDRFRLCKRDADPAPLYKADIEAEVPPAANRTGPIEQGEEQDLQEASREFAFERDLKNYLVKNLNLIEPGLRLYEEEEITGVEFSVGGRFIDILAIGRDGAFVVIELKVSRGYDRVIGQLLRYMGWIEKNMESAKKVRGVIVANEISDDLRLAASRISDVQLIEYEISFKLRPIIGLIPLKAS